MRTEENNKLIAEFMEFEFHNGHYWVKIGKSPKDWRTLPPMYMDFHQYDWIMPVIEKIENLGAKVLIGRMFCEIEYTNVFVSSKHYEKRIVSGVKINAINGAVVEFIIWYNQNK